MNEIPRDYRNAGQRRAGNSERFALAALTWISEPGDSRLGAAVRDYGPERTLELIRTRRLPWPGGHSPVPGARRMQVRRAAAGRVPGAAEIAAAFHSGLRLICPGDAEWPAGLGALGVITPIALWARGSGDLAEARERSVAITGTRACTAFAGRAAGNLAADVSGRGWTVVSGGARGTDAAAHRGALGAGRVTIAVLAGGLDRPSPHVQRRLMREIAERGVLVSEQPPGRPATRTLFLARNRIIAALSCGTVIAGTYPGSSAIEAARYARYLGQPVMAAPGSRGWSPGCATLIRSGQAVPVTSAEEIIETITAAGPTAPAGQARNPR